MQFQNIKLQLKVGFWSWNFDCSATFGIGKRALRARTRTFSLKFQFGQQISVPGEYLQFNFLQSLLNSWRYLTRDVIQLVTWFNSWRDSTRDVIQLVTLLNSWRYLTRDVRHLLNVKIADPGLAHANSQNARKFNSELSW